MTQKQEYPQDYPKELFELPITAEEFINALSSQPIKERDNLITIKETTDNYELTLQSEKLDEADIDVFSLALQLYSKTIPGTDRLISVREFLSRIKKTKINPNPTREWLYKSLSRLSLLHINIQYKSGRYVTGGVFSVFSVTPKDDGDPKSGMIEYSIYSNMIDCLEDEAYYRALHRLAVSSS